MVHTLKTASYDPVDPYSSAVQVIVDVVVHATAVDYGAMSASEQEVLLDVLDALHKGDPACNGMAARALDESGIVSPYDPSVVGEEG